MMYLRALFIASILVGAAATCLPDTALYSYVGSEPFNDEFRSSNRLNVLSDNIHAVVATNAPNPNDVTTEVPANSEEFTSAIRIIKVRGHIN